ncbi:MAG: tetratricopeptide repeat protein [Gemmatimonadota bacterium]
MIAPPRFLATPVGEHLSDLVREAFEQAGVDGPDTAGVERFGPYRITGEIGRGGMGMVYEAERADRTYDRRVAIKTVRFARAGGRLADEFEAERRILAGLEHENIARLYDAGTTPDGIPYFVMELVEGRRIDVYCDEEDLSVDERLALFERMCEAVEYAHGKLVVHGDIKPGNILVTAGGVPKLLDFGVAHLLESAEPDRDAAGASEADTPALAMTPEYASPEQLRGEPVTTAADVYALGILLYVLLAGRHPYPPVRRTREAVERAIRETTIGPPSEALPPDDRPRARRLRGDVDAIVLAAIQPDAGSRYGSVGELRRDLRDHRNGLPVAARSATWRYRTAKFVRRHRVGLAAAALVFVALGAGLAGTAWQARAAERQAERAERTRDYLVGLFETFDPDAAGVGAVTAEELLDRGADQLEGDLAGQPAVQAELSGVLGRLYQRMGLYDKARPLLASARAGLLGAYGERHPETVTATARLAYVLYDQGEYEDAEPLARAALAARRDLFGEADTAVANSLSDLGSIRSRQGEWAEAEALYARALEIYRASGTPEQVATGLSNLGVVHNRQEKHEEAVRVLEESLAIRREIHGDRHTSVAYSLLNLAEAHNVAGRYDEAERLLRECIALRRDLLGDDHPHTGLALNNLGSVLQEAGDLEGAQAAHEEALAVRRAALGDEHPDVAASLNNLGVVAYFQEDHSGAADLFAEVIPIWRAQLGDTHPNVLSSLNNLGAARRAAGEYEAAELVQREVLKLRREVLGPDHPDIGQSLNNLALILYDLGATEDAERTYREAIAHWRGSLGDEHPTLAFALDGLGRLLTETGRAAEAEALLREALTLREAALEPESSMLGLSRARLGLALAELGQAEESRALLEAAYPVLEARYGPDDDLVRQVRGAM